MQSSSSLFLSPVSVPGRSASLFLCVSRSRRGVLLPRFLPAVPFCVHSVRLRCSTQFLHSGLFQLRLRPLFFLVTLCVCVAERCAFPSSVFREVLLSSSLCCRAFGFSLPVFAPRLFSVNVLPLLPSGAQKKRTPGKRFPARASFPRCPSLHRAAPLDGLLSFAHPVPWCVTANSSNVLAGAPLPLHLLSPLSRLAWYRHISVACVLHCLAKAASQASRIPLFTSSLISCRLRGPRAPCFLFLAPRSRRVLRVLRPTVRRLRFSRVFLPLLGTPKPFLFPLSLLPSLAKSLAPAPTFFLGVSVPVSSLSSVPCLLSPAYLVGRALSRKPNPHSSHKLACRVAFLMAMFPTRALSCTPALPRQCATSATPWHFFVPSLYGSRTSPSPACRLRTFIPLSLPQPNASLPCVFRFLLLFPAPHGAPPTPPRLSANSISFQPSHAATDSHHTSPRRCSLPRSLLQRPCRCWPSCLRCVSDRSSYPSPRFPLPSAASIATFASPLRACRVPLFLSHSAKRCLFRLVLSLALPSLPLFRQVSCASLAPALLLFCFPCLACVLSPLLSRAPRRNFL
ncbi:hypothetical protein TvY486_0018950 [Trypanosoma vivax Y486]|uniref:Transmembrane protein n=1 Tax=Trypanosoma vivax (strain Y486) TaxID=1055687 RepID=F9WNT2_TRYVY|nr:hypothetical protein TvY486_0018950 [Trypanosoma vivax Y486]|eukprot:CCD19203.1 hypothetical protein TvY486_0018950 [Trypanosoma vivax Y486]